MKEAFYKSWLSPFDQSEYMYRKQSGYANVEDIFWAACEQ